MGPPVDESLCCEHSDRIGYLLPPQTLLVRLSRIGSQKRREGRDGGEKNCQGFLYTLRLTSLPSSPDSGQGTRRPSLPLFLASEGKGERGSGRREFWGKGIGFER